MKSRRKYRYRVGDMIRQRISEGIFIYRTGIVVARYKINDKPVYVVEFQTVSQEIVREAEIM